jgi:hypothetical protein
VHAENLLLSRRLEDLHDIAVDLAHDLAIELAGRLEEPNLREALLKTARDWMRDAEALRRAALSRSAPPTSDDGVRPDDKRACVSSRVL